jgi:hypothetical protein
VPVPEPFSAFAIFLSRDLSCEIETRHSEESEGKKRAAANDGDSSQDGTNFCEVAKRTSDWARAGGVAALTFLYGHLVMPCCLQSFFSEVRHIPSCFATAFSGRCKYCVSSSIETTLCVGILAFPRTIWHCLLQSLRQTRPNPRELRLVLNFLDGYHESQLDTL